MDVFSSVTHGEYPNNITERFHSIPVLKNHKDVISDILMEVLVLLEKSEENPFSNLKQLKSATSPTKSFGTSPMGLVSMFR